MSRKLLIALDSGTPPQQDALTTFILRKGWGIWHWIDDLWLLDDVPPELGPREIWAELIASDPKLIATKGLILRLDGDILYWGGNVVESWHWLRERWGRPDLPRPQAGPGPL